MRLYAERLGDALQRRHVDLRRVRPPGIVPDPWLRGSAAWNKIDAYAGRFVVYPRLVRGFDTDVVHIADHGQGYLIGNLNPQRTLVTCHDVILLALAAGRIGGAPIPQMALQLFRISLEFVKLAARVVADSRSTRDDLVKDLEDQLAIGVARAKTDPFGTAVDLGAATGQPRGSDHDSRVDAVRRSGCCADAALLQALGAGFAGVAAATCPN